MLAYLAIMSCVFLCRVSCVDPLNVRARSGVELVQRLGDPEVLRA